MNITIHDTQIILQADDISLPYTLLTKPDIADYSNDTTRPLVKSYHLERESIWERFSQCVQNLEEHYQGNSCAICYLMAFGSLYTPLLANSQAKNVLFYGNSVAAPFLAALQDFMTFLENDSSLIALPQNPFLFSGLANSSWHAAIIDMDICHDLQSVCDIMSKVRKGGTVLLYTVSCTPTGDIAALLSYAKETSYSSCTLYIFTMNSALCDLVYPYTAEALVLMQTEQLLTQIGELKQFTQNMESETCSPEDCLCAIELLRQAENILFASYDYLENPELPLYANTLKEAVMDYYISISGTIDTPTCLERLRLTAQVFYTALEEEFQC